jgi:hypothetical protein
VLDAVPLSLSSVLFVVYGSCQKSPQPASANAPTHTASSKALATLEFLAFFPCNRSCERHRAQKDITIKTSQSAPTLAVDGIR